MCEREYDFNVETNIIIFLTIYSRIYISLLHIYMLFFYMKITNFVF